MRKVLLTLAALLLVGLVTFAAGMAATDGSIAPAAITEDSACPATRCASGSCHGYDDVPEPDGIHELACPERDCSSVECHAWDQIASGRHKASDASLNLWILAPSLLVGCLVMLMRRL
jgi:hypothetical protein